MGGQIASLRRLAPRAYTESMSARLPAVLCLVVLLGTASAAGAEVQLTIQDGKVSLVASHATLREILAEWERVGQTRIINADRVTAAPLTLQLEDVPESQALGILLRSVNGYVAAPRSVPDASVSRFDRIMIMPGTPRPRVASMAPAPFSPPPAPMQVEPPIFQPLPDGPADDPNAERPVRTVPAPASRGAVFGVFPRPQVETPPPPARTSAPTATPQPAPSPGVSVPGMIVPMPPADQDTPRDR